MRQVGKYLGILLLLIIMVGTPLLIGYIMFQT